uniref:Uracil-DNA glycosylase n=2 Tax=Hirondellea gigas TaxID=1518452 RepID=A0A6A7FWX5_9CRUS
MRKLIFIMSQKSITSFFKPNSTANRKGPFGAQVASKMTEKTQQMSETKKNAPHEIKASIEDAENCDPDEELQGELEQQCIDTPVLHKTIGRSWFTALKPEFSKPYFKKLSDHVTEERKKCTVFPPPRDVYSWSHHCSVDAVKVVILGQDPYHDVGQAHGLCFSVQPGVTPPPSLKNMYKELESDIPGFKAPRHGFLEGWATQGVLLLNAVLTVKAHTANSHKARGWEQFTTAVIEAVAQRNQGVVFMLWGAYAQKKLLNISKDKHHMLFSVHPSPLSAHRGFLGCKHFSQCNDLLRKQGKAPIDWSYLPQYSP